jgi:hypothetical protein
MARTLASGVIEPIVGGLDPVRVDTADTAQAELQRLQPLVEELAAWGGVYERWRAHPSAAERPAAASLNPADHEVLDRLSGVEFGRLIAAGERLGAVGAAGESLAGAAADVGTRVANAWPGRDGEAAVRRWEALRSAAADHGAAAHTVGSRLGEAAVAARGDLRVAVHRVLDGSEGFQHMRGGSGAEPLDWLHEIDQLEREVDDPMLTERARWSRVRAQLDDMTARYARVITLLRASLDEVVSGVRQAWDQLELDLRRVDPDPYGRLVPPREATVPPRGAPVPPREAPISPRQLPVAPTGGRNGPAGEAPDGAPAATEPSPPPQPPVPSSSDSGAIRAALGPPVADLTTPVTSATRAPSGDGPADGTPDGTGPALGDTNAHHAERTGEVRVPQLPDGPATLDHPAIEPVQRLDTVHAAELPALNTLLVEVVAFIAAVLTTFGLTSRPS